MNHENRLFEDTLLSLMEYNARVSDIKYEDFVDGEGIRIALWLPGCSFYCKGCFNKANWDYEAGRPFTEIDLMNITNTLLHTLNDGITLLGGEPIMIHNENQYKRYQERNCATALALAKLTKFYEKSVWIYSGATYEELIATQHPLILEVLKYTDVLIDGKFEEDKKDLGLRFRGSSNQRLLRLKNGEIVSIE